MKAILYKKSSSSFLEGKMMELGGDYLIMVQCTGKSLLITKPSCAWAFNFPSKFFETCRVQLYFWFTVFGVSVYSQYTTVVHENFIGFLKFKRRNSSLRWTSSNLLFFRQVIAKQFFSKDASRGIHLAVRRCFQGISLDQ